MSRSEVHKRYLLKEKHRKQYTFTKTKVVVGFLLSVLTSVFLGSYLEQYGPALLNRAASTAIMLVTEASKHQDSTKSRSQKAQKASLKPSVPPAATTSLEHPNKQPSE